jgi:Tetracyclin repressor-like, C-terminal domain
MRADARWSTALLAIRRLQGDLDERGAPGREPSDCLAGSRNISHFKRRGRAEHRDRIAAVYSDAARIPGLSDVRRELFELGPRRAAAVIERAVARGELPAATDPALVIRALIAPIYFRLTVTAEPVDPAAADQAAQIALAAARAGVFRRGASDNPEAKHEQTGMAGA